LSGVSLSSADPKRNRELGFSFESAQTGLGRVFFRGSGVFRILLTIEVEGEVVFLGVETFLGRAVFFLLGVGSEETGNFLFFDFISFLLFGSFFTVSPEGGGSK